MTIPDYQTLMRPVLEHAANGEVAISETVETLADKFQLTEEERDEKLPSGVQTKFSNRVNWAKSYLKQAGLVDATGRGLFKITDRGRTALEQTHAKIDRKYLLQFEEFQEFQSRTAESKPSQNPANDTTDDDESTPDELLRKAHGRIEASLANELLDLVRRVRPAFFEDLIIELMLAMGYGGTSEDAGRSLGRTGDGGVDGVIDQDPLGVDQIYLQAKRYAEGNIVGAGAIRDFFGALSLKKASKGIFVTTSSFSEQARQTARDLGSRIVLIDGGQLTRLMIRYQVGCREKETLSIKELDESYFDGHLEKNEATTVVAD